jgi:replicative DNA helicase
MGKTAFFLTMARNMTETHHIPVAFFSLEMPDARW